MSVQKLKLRKKTKARVAKTGTKSKSKSKSNVIPFPVVARKVSDSVDKIVIEAKHIKKDNASDKIRELMSDRDRNYVRIGAALSKVRAGKWYEREAKTFGEYIRTNFGFTMRTAQYMIGSYEAVERHGLHERDIRGIGWSKFRLVAPLLDEKNKRRWLKKARRLSMASLESMVKKARKSKGGVRGSAEPGSDEKVTAFRFQAHQDQAKNIKRALAEAQRLTGTEHATVALDYVCTAFLSTVSGGKVKPIKIGDVLKRLVEAAPSQKEAVLQIKREIRRALPGFTIEKAEKPEAPKPKKLKKAKAEESPPETAEAV